MHENPSKDRLSTQIKLIRKYLKLKIQEDNVSFRNHSKARNHIYDLIQRTVAHGESHSALMIGPRGCGKTTLINSVLHQLSKEVDLASDAIIVRLNGLVHHDEKLALKAITAQMQLENAVDGKVFGTFAEQLSFLISCLTSGVDRRCRSMVFLLEECDMFCRVGRAQTLLYNLFDITHQDTAPMCVISTVKSTDVIPAAPQTLSLISETIYPGNFYQIFRKGITNRIDVMDLLEKRVKSRFSHRHIFIFPNESSEDDPPMTPLETHRGVMMELLSVPVKKEVKKRRRNKSFATEEPMETDQEIHPIPEEILAQCKIDPKVFAALDSNFVEDWNSQIRSLVENQKVIDAVEKYCYFMANEQVFRNILFQLVSKLKPSKPCIEPTDFCQVVDSTVAPEHKVRQIQSLSILELCLVIAMLHGSEILDYQPLNFEMVLHRYQKFAQTNSSSQSVPRPVILKAFEHLQSLEIIVPARGHGDVCGGGATQKEHRLYALALSAADIRTAVNTAKALPTEISHWLDNSIG